LAKKLNDGKQPFLRSYHFAALFWQVLLGVYSLAYIVSKQRVMIRLSSTFSNNIGLLQYWVGDQNMRASPGHHLLSFAEWLVLFVTNETIKIFLSQNKFIEAWQRQTPRIFNWFTENFRV